MNFSGTIRINRIGFFLICILLIIFILYLTPSRKGNMPKVVNLKDLLCAAIEAAERGGKEVAKTLDNKTKEKIEYKDDTLEGVPVPVTSADYRSHCVMFHGIDDLFPSVTVISEEKKENCQKVQPLNLEKTKLLTAELPDLNVDASKIAVWIDPLDATKEFTEGLLEYVTTMVCVSYEGRPVIGVIHKPFGAEPKTHWVWMNRKHSFPFDKMKPFNGNNEIVIVSRSHGSNVADVIKPIFGNKSKVIEAGGSGYKSEEVIFGNVSAYIHKTEISKWDICAGDSMISSLGGRFTDLCGEDIIYSPDSEHLTRKGVLAAPLEKHQVYVENTKKMFSC